MTHMADVEYLTVEEAAAEVRVSKMTVYRLVKSGRIPSVRIGGQFRIPRRAWREYLARGGA